MQQKETLEIMQQGHNVFLTGEAGTGKTFVLARYIQWLRHKHIPIATTASTGIAATHIDGVTVDSWSGLGIKDDISEQEIRDLSKKYFLRRRIQKTKVIIIDEISMIQGRRFDAVNRIMQFMRNSTEPFGGAQIILCGDLFQLPPVTRNHDPIDFIFKSQVWNLLKLKICYLSVPRRQSDPKLLHVLSSIRHNQVDQKTMDLLTQAQHNSNFPITPTKLYTHNVDVDRINQEELNSNPNELHTYPMTTLGPAAVVEAMQRTCLAPQELQLKKDALVMFVRNNFERGYVNGTLGKVVGFTRSNSAPIVQTSSGEKITVEPANWTISEDEKIVAQLIQIPLRLAWAITVHKSQGMTLDAAQIDLSKSFVEGMGYVALSRVRAISGLQLLGLNQMALRVNPEVSRFDQILRQASLTTQAELNKQGRIKKWLAKRHFVTKLTS